MGNENKTGGPITNDIDYFFRICKYAKELMSLQHKYKPEKYEAFYRLKVFLGDSEFYRIDLKNT
tara:strand:+ start:178 stop:369 length:192 start_codon:yes stop_codon:yes gene_type:complete